MQIRIFSCSAVVVLLAAAGFVTADDCSSSEGYKFEGINWNYKATGYGTVPLLDKRSGGSKAVVYCVFYTQLPTADKVPPFRIDYAQDDKKRIDHTQPDYVEDKRAPSRDSTTRIELDGNWVPRDICGGKAFINVFNASPKYHIQPYLEYCRSYGNVATQPSYAELFFDKYAEAKDCPDVSYGSYVQIYDSSDPRKTFMYVEPKTTGRIRLLELQLAVCNLVGKPRNSTNPVWGSSKPAGTLYSGIDWTYPRFNYIPDVTHYRYGDRKNLGVEPIATRSESSPSYCVSLERSFDDDDLHHNWKRADYSPVSGTWQAEFLCNKSAWIQVFVVEKETKEIKRSERMCMWSTDASTIAAQIQPNWASVYRFNGSDNYKGVYVEIFNNEVEFGVKFKRSFFSGDLAVNGIIDKVRLEKDICVPSRGPKADVSEMRKKKKLARDRKTKTKCGQPTHNNSNENNR